MDLRSFELLVPGLISLRPGVEGVSRMPLAEMNIAVVKREGRLRQYLLNRSLRTITDTSWVEHEGIKTLFREYNALETAN